MNSKQTQMIGTRSGADRLAEHTLPLKIITYAVWAVWGFVVATIVATLLFACIMMWAIMWAAFTYHP